VNKTYICVCCNLEYERRAEEDAIKECEELFPGLPKDERRIVCEPCFVKIMNYNKFDKMKFHKFIMDKSLIQ
jgi:hypothetical protein